MNRQSTALVIFVSMLSIPAIDTRADEATSDIPKVLQRWLQPQQWERDTDGPVVELGKKGQFDDTHIFAPCVAKIGKKYHLWYSGSTGAVANRVFHLGLATSHDGRQFEKRPDATFRFTDGQRSILTTTLLRQTNGAPLLSDGRLRMWFSSTHFSGDTGLHTLHESHSKDGISWSKPSAPQMKHVYAPSVLKDGAQFRMWYTDVSSSPWVIRLATSEDGREWTRHPEPLLKPEADWEKSRLFYPTVLKTDGVYLMWYGSYWSKRGSTTAIGMAASVDGIRWYRNPHSPVLRPDPDRPWESHYTTSQSVIRAEDGSFRIWYASRKKPPFVNKYFAINTARWRGPAIKQDR